MAQITEDQVDQLADELYVALTEDLPEITPPDLSSPDFTFEEDNDSALYSEIPELGIDQLTVVQLEGSGAFDKMMAAADIHLQREFKGNRIVGAEYAKVYGSLINSLMGNAVQFTLGSQTAHWQAVTAQMQARQAEIEVVTARVTLETAKVNASTAVYQMEQAKAQVGLTKMEIANANAQHLLLRAQLIEQEYKNEELLPLTKAQQKYTVDTLLVDQHTLNVANIDEARFKVDELMPITRDQQQYNLDTILVDQHTLIGEQIESERAKTLDTRRDSTVVAGLIGKQKDVQDQQIDSFKRADEYKIAKMYFDGHISQISILDVLPSPPDELASTEINEVMAAARAAVGL